MGYIKKSIEIEDLNREIGLLRTVCGHLNELRELDRLERQELEGRLMEGRSDAQYQMNKKMEAEHEITNLMEEVKLLKDALRGEADIDPQITPEELKLMERGITTEIARNGANMKDGLLEVSTGIYGEMDVDMRFKLVSAKIFHPGG